MRTSMYSIALAVVSAFWGAFPASAAQLSSAAEGTMASALANYNQGNVFKGGQEGTLAYRLFVPPASQAGQRYPLVLWLEGGGNRGNDLTGWTQHAPAFTGHEFQAKTPCFVLAPRCPKGKQMWADLNSHQGPLSPAMQLTMELLEETRRQYHIDPQRVYIAGFSAGGFGVWDAITRFPERFAAAMPVSGGGDASKVQPIMHLPIWAFHGDADKEVPVGRSRRMIEAIKALGGTPKYTEFPKAGHVEAVRKTFQEAGVLDWLMAQKRP